MAVWGGEGEIFGFSKFEYRNFPPFLSTLGKRKVFIGLVSPILKLGQKVIVISDFIWPQFICCTEGTVMTVFNVYSVQYNIIPSLILEKIRELKKIARIPGSNVDPPGAHD